MRQADQDNIEMELDTPLKVTRRFLLAARKIAMITNPGIQPRSLPSSSKSAAESCVTKSWGGS